MCRTRRGGHYSTHGGILDLLIVGEREHGFLPTPRRLSSAKDCNFRGGLAVAGLVCIGFVLWRPRTMADTPLPSTRACAWNNMSVPPVCGHHDLEAWQDVNTCFGPSAWPVPCQEGHHDRLRAHRSTPVAQGCCSVSASVGGVRKRSARGDRPFCLFSCCVWSLDLGLGLDHSHDITLALRHIYLGMVGLKGVFD